MNMLIDLDERIVNEAKTDPNYYPVYYFEYIWKAIANGQPLPDDCEILTKDAYEDLCKRASADE